MQCGATRGKGTDFALHLFAAAIEYASKASLCIVVVFLDLVKAFVRILREIVVGLPADDVVIASEDQLREARSSADGVDFLHSSACALAAEI